MRLILLAAILIGCGSDNDETINRVVAEQAQVEETEPETLTVMMCQQATACNANGECFDAEKPVEFVIDSSLIYWQACFEFRPCEGENVYTEQQIADYKNNHCER